MTKIIFNIALIPFTLIFLAPTYPVYSQPVNDINLDVNIDSTKNIKNIISVNLKDSQVPVVHNPLKTGDNLEFKNIAVHINESNTVAKSIKVRGTTSLYYRRKSYTFKLTDKLPFYNLSDTFKLKKFYTVSLSMDKNYVRNAISYNILSLFDFSIPFYSYATLNLNGSSEGIYMVFYPPPDYAMDYCGSEFVLRRGYHSSIKKSYSKDLSKKMEREYRRKFSEIYSGIIRKYHSRQLFDSLSARMDLNNYFDWLIYNYIFKNGDYTDEVYFYWDSSKNKFKTIPWDFDDLLMAIPHEGNISRSSKLKDKLMYSMEDKLDVAIALDPYVYNEYVIEFMNFLNKFNPEQLKNILESIYVQILPYYLTPDIISQSYFDKYRLTNLGLLKYDLTNIYSSISERMELLESTLKVQLK